MSDSSRREWDVLSGLSQLTHCQEACSLVYKCSSWFHPTCFVAHDLLARHQLESTPSSINSGPCLSPAKEKGSWNSSLHKLLWETQSALPIYYSLMQTLKFNDCRRVNGAILPLANPSEITQMTRINSSPGSLFHYDCLFYGRRMKHS